MRTALLQQSLDALIAECKTFGHLLEIDPRTEIYVIEARSLDAAMRSVQDLLFTLRDDRVQRIFNDLVQHAPD